MTLTQFIVVLGVAAMAFGPKELPKVARVLGVLTGQAAGSIFALRQRMSQLAEHTEIHEVGRMVLMVGCGLCGCVSAAPPSDQVCL